MLFVKGAIGAVLLFLGRELNFVFAGAMAFLIGQRLTPLLPSQWPGWAINERGGFVLSGFLAGGYVMAEWYTPNMLVIPPIPFILGGVVGALVLGLFTEWALIVISSLIGGYYLTSMFRLAPIPRILITAGLVIIGAVTQAIIMRAQRQ
jgi:hypothetical protein